MHCLKWGRRRFNLRHFVQIQKRPFKLSPPTCTTFFIFLHLARHYDSVAASCRVVCTGAISSYREILYVFNWFAALHYTIWWNILFNWIVECREIWRVCGGFRELFSFASVWDVLLWTECNCCFRCLLLMELLKIMHCFVKTLFLLLVGWLLLNTPNTF